MSEENKPKLELTSCDGNAFAILGAAQKSAERAGWTKAQIDEFLKEAKSGDYDHVLQTCMKRFDVS